LYDGNSFQSGNYHICNGTRLCANVTILAFGLDAFWSSFALLQLGGCFDVGGTSKAMPTMSNTYTPSLFMLLQSPKLVFLFVGDEVFFISSHMSTHEVCLSTHTEHEGM
jgi:hypothetical protein